MKSYLGIELGSTRIKAVVIDETGAVLASGAFARENKPLSETVWTYDLADARRGLAAANRRRRRRVGNCAAGGGS